MKKSGVARKPVRVNVVVAVVDEVGAQAVVDLQVVAVAEEEQLRPLT